MRYDIIGLIQKFDSALDGAVPDDGTAGADLTTAMRYSVLGGGKRVRPHLVLATAIACHGGLLDEDTADLVVRIAVAIELIHSASLVHDDLPCFDDADLRRGQPTVHQAFGVPMAVLVGDALIVEAFDVLASYEGEHVQRAQQLVRHLARATGAHEGIIGGQSLELVVDRWAEDSVSFDDVQEYHRKKTAALFDYSMRAAAIAVGRPPQDQGGWGEAGTKLGLAFQLIDDLLDLHVDEEVSGKTAGRDEALDRPSGARLEGYEPTVQRLVTLLDESCALMYRLAENPEPIVRLMENIDAMLVQIELMAERSHAGATRGREDGVRVCSP